MRHSYVDPSLCCLGQGFIVFAQTTTPTQPRQRSFNDPASWQYLELVGVSWTLDYLHNPARQRLNPVNQLSRVASVRPDQLEAGETPYQFVDNKLSPIPVLDISRVGHDGQEQTHGVYHDVPLASRHLLASVITARPPFSVVFTDWLSIMAALGVGSLPSACRTMGRRVSWIRSHVPSLLHLRKYLYTLPQGGRSWGTIRQGHPDRRTYRMPFTTSRRLTVRGLPPGLASGSNGASSFHWSSVRSLGYLLRFIPTV